MPINLGLYEIFYPYPDCLKRWLNRFRAACGFERRRYKRQYRRVETNLPVVLSWGEKHGKGTVTDIGFGGCRLETDFAIPENCTVEIHLPGRRHGESEVITKAEVIRLDKQTSSTGLEFDRSPRATGLRSFIDNLIAAKITGARQRGKSSSSRDSVITIKPLAPR